MQEILKLNEISSLVNDVFKDSYNLTENATAPVAVMLRSYKMHDFALPETVLCVGRAGAGTNNIPVGDYAEKGVVVFNTPGANANAVKELVIASLLLSSRRICQGVNWSNGLSDSDKTVAEQVEKGKKAFGGFEILGKTLGIYGLGAIGRKVAESSKALGMKVIGFDPYISESGAKALEGIVEIVDNKEDLFKLADYITFHVPLTAETKNLVNAESIAHMKDGVKLINLSRGEIVDNEAIISACKSGAVGAYVTDFPNASIVNQHNIICIPHLGASTEEAEDNCAVMAANELVDYIENGNITNSVNFPSLKAERKAVRIVVLYKGCVKDSISSIISKSVYTVNYNEKNGFGVCIIDSDKALDSSIVDAIKSINGVIKVRVI